MTIRQIVDEHPDLLDVLVKEYGFFCASCFLAEFETLKEGAKVHGIEGVDFEEMMDYLNNYGSTKPSSE